MAHWFLNVPPPLTYTITIEQQLKIFVCFFLFAFSCSKVMTIMENVFSSWFLLRFSSLSQLYGNHGRCTWRSQWKTLVRIFSFYELLFFLIFHRWCEVHQEIVFSPFCFHFHFFSHFLFSFSLFTFSTFLLDLILPLNIFFISHDASWDLRGKHRCAFPIEEDRSALSTLLKGCYAIYHILRTSPPFSTFY